MRFGTRRGMILALGFLATAIAVAWPGSAVFGGGWHTIPREVPAVDFRTGDVMQAPPIPYGEYAKDYAGTVHEYAGLAAGAVHGCIGKLCSLCSGGACGMCGGKGLFGHGLCGGCGGDGCGACNGNGHNLMKPCGHNHGPDAGACTAAGCGGTGFLHKFGLGHKSLTSSGHSHGHSQGQGHSHGHAGSLCGPGMNCAAPQGAIRTSQASAQGIITSPCGLCSGKGLFSGRLCGGCGGKGLLTSHGFGSACGGCGGRGFLGNGSACGGCGGKGLLTNHGFGSACGGCGGRGFLGNGSACGMCGGKGHTAGANTCGSCGGKGCSACGGTGLINALVGLPHHLMGGVHAAIGHFTHAGEIEYFVGPGGPVPLTPGYVNYVNPVRSPRDYFAFPPFSERAQP